MLLQRWAMRYELGRLSSSLNGVLQVLEQNSLSAEVVLKDPEEDLLHSKKERRKREKKERKEASRKRRREGTKEEEPLIAADTRLRVGIQGKVIDCFVYELPEKLIDISLHNWAQFVLDSVSNASLTRCVSPE